MGKDVITGDEVGLQLWEQVLATSPCTYNQGQVRDFETLTRYRTGKILEQNATWFIKEFDRVTKKQTGITFYLTTGDIMTDKPATKERNGEVHALTTHDCFLRKCTYEVPVYCSIQIIRFSTTDPSIDEVEKKRLIRAYKHNKRVVQKLQNVRVVQHEASVIQNMLRMEKIRAGVTGNNDKSSPIVVTGTRNENGEDEEEGDMEEEEGEEEEGETEEEEHNDDDDDDDDNNPYVLSLHNSPQYQQKKRECQLLCRMTPGEQKKYPFLISQQIFPRHTIFHLPLMPHTKLCHSFDDLEKNNDAMYMTGGTFLISGVEHPFMENMYLAYNEIYAWEKNMVECRSGHSMEQSRGSSSTLRLRRKEEEKKKSDVMYLAWELPYLKDILLPFMVLFQAMGLFDVERVKAMLRFQIHSHFHFEYNARRIPWPILNKWIDDAFSYHIHGSNLIETQEDAWLFVGRMTQQTRKFTELSLERESEDASLELSSINTNTTMSVVDVSGIDPQHQQQPLAANLIGKHGKANNKWFAFVVTEPMERYHLTGEGKKNVNREVLPHIGYTMAEAGDKIWFLGLMAKVLLIHAVAPHTDDPATFATTYSRDLLAFKRLQFCGMKIGSGLLKSALTNQLKEMAKRKYTKALLEGSPLHPDDSMDHLRVTRQIFRSIGNGILKAGPNPAANMFGGSGNQVMNHIRASGSGGGGGGPPAASGPGASNPLTQAPIKARGGGAAKASRDQTGITQHQNNVNICSQWSQQRRINKADSYGAGGGSSEARDIHDDWQVVCPFDTPDSRSCGLVKSHSLFSRNSFPTVIQQQTIAFLRSEPGMITDKMALSNNFYDSTSCSNNNNNNNNNIYIAILLNCKCVGYMLNEDAIRLSKKLKTHRFLFAGDSYMSVILSTVESKLMIYTDQCRLIAGYLVVKNMRRLFGPTSTNNAAPLWTSLSEEELFENNFMVMLDKMELMENVRLAKSIDDVRLIDEAFANESSNTNPFDYCELSLFTTLSMSTSFIPFTSHNQPTRMIYGSQMIRQDKGPKRPNAEKRLEKVQHRLLYPSHPLIKTKTWELLSFQDTTFGFQATVAIMCHHNDNMEDAIVCNQGAIERGLGRAIYNSSTTVTQKTFSHALGRECFMKPDPEHTLEMKSLNYDHLRPCDGLPYPGTVLSTNDVMVGKVVRWNKPKRIHTKNGQVLDIRYTDTSMETSEKHVGMVERVVVTTDGQNQQLAIISVSRLCKFCKGDKTTSLYAQKCTCIPCDEVNMPYNEQGIKPMFIINPHAFTSRMSIAQPLEQLAGIAAAAYGTTLHATPYSDSIQTDLARLMEVVQEDGTKYYPVYDRLQCAQGNPTAEDLDNDPKQLTRFIIKALEAKGIYHQGKNIMYNGYTGKQIQNAIFMGPLFQQIMIHMAADKLSYRAEGKMHQGTRQPVERSGYKVGEMEKNCCVAHGSAHVILERHKQLSDPHTSFVCQICGNMARSNLRDQIFYCSVCDNTSSVVKISITFAFKSIVQTLASSYIVPRLIVRDPASMK